MTNAELAEPTEPALLRHRDATIETWTLNRPESRNTLSEPDMIEQLESAIAQVDADPDVRAVILTGAGPAFSSGGNIKHMHDRDGMFGGSSVELRQSYRHGIQRIPRALYHCEVPTIAAVNGPAIGAGCDLALMCDLRIASRRAIFAESFVRVGLIPGDGGAWFLPRIVGPARAAEMAFTGEQVDADTARAWGLVSEVVDPDDLMPAARQLADRIAVNPPHVLRMTKKLLHEGQHQSLESLLELSAAYQAVAHHTDDHREAVAALLERPPKPRRPVPATLQLIHVAAGRTRSGSTAPCAPASSLAACSWRRPAAGSPTPAVRPGRCTAPTSWSPDPHGRDVRQSAAG